MSTQIRIFKHGSAEYAKALALRTKILRDPLGLKFTPEEMKKDETDIHFGLFDGDEILACLTLTKLENGKIKMRQVAVAAQTQGTGLGRQLSTAAEEYAKDNGFKIMTCNARKTAVPFYKKLGYNTVGEEFTEVNIPHYQMEKQLQ